MTVTEFADLLVVMMKYCRSIPAMTAVVGEICVCCTYPSEYIAGAMVEAGFQYSPRDSILLLLKRRADVEEGLRGGATSLAAEQAR